MEDYITALILYCIYLRPARIYYFTNKNTSLGFVSWCFLGVCICGYSLLIYHWYQIGISIISEMEKAASVIKTGSYEMQHICLLTQQGQQDISAPSLRFSKFDAV